jgi:hypothetical protein
VDFTTGGVFFDDDLSGFSAFFSFSFSVFFDLSVLAVDVEVVGLVALEYGVLFLILGETLGILLFMLFFLFSQIFFKINLNYSQL